MSYIEKMCCVNWRFRSFVKYSTATEIVFQDEKHCDVGVQQYLFYIVVSIISLRMG